MHRFLLKGFMMPMPGSTKVSPSVRRPDDARTDPRRSAAKAMPRPNDPRSLVYECTQLPMLIIDPQGLVVAVNPAFTRVTGYPENEVIGKSWHLQTSYRHSPGFIEEMWSTLKQTGHWQGEVWNRRRNGETYPAWQCTSAVKDSTGKATHYVSIVSDIGEVKRRDARWRYRAHHDGLTGLPNRLHFTDELARCVERARRRHQTFAVMFVDLDHFKWINDTLGHPAGDDLLAEIGRRLQGAVRAEDLVARIGGDEFTVLLEDMSCVADAERMAHKVIAAVGKPLKLQGQPLSVSASIGIAFFPDHGHDANALLQAADHAMYRAKQAGRRTFVCSSLSPLSDLTQPMRLSGDVNSQA